MRSWLCGAHCIFKSERDSPVALIDYAVVPYSRDEFSAAWQRRRNSKQAPFFKCSSSQGLPFFPVALYSCQVGCCEFSSFAEAAWLCLHTVCSQQQRKFARDPNPKKQCGSTVLYVVCLTACVRCGPKHHAQVLAVVGLLLFPRYKRRRIEDGKGTWPITVSAKVACAPFRFTSRCMVPRLSGTGMSKRPLTRSPKRPTSPFLQ